MILNMAYFHQEKRPRKIRLGRIQMKSMEISPLEIKQLVKI